MSSVPVAVSLVASMAGMTAGVSAGASMVAARLTCGAWPTFPKDVTLTGHRRLYISSDMIGSGTFGRVYRGKLTDPQIDGGNSFDVAIKVFSSGHLGYRFALPELVFYHDMSSTLARNHIVKCHALIMPDQLEGCAGIVMELCEGDLISYAENLEPQHRNSLGGFSQAVFLRVFHPIACALAAIAQHGIVWRDLKPNNILYTQDDGGSGALLFKAADFGVAATLDADTDLAPVEKAEVMGTLPYMCPGDLVRGAFSAASDVWALAVTAVQMWDPPAFDAFVSTLNSATRMPHPMVPFNIPCRELWLRCFDERPEQRPTAADIESRLYDALHSDSAILL